MKTICRILPHIIFVILLSSCSVTNDLVGKGILEESEIITDSDYIRYKDKEIPKEEEEIPHDGAVHVSFAKNSKVPINYYYDSRLLELIDDEDCYLKPGDSIYAEVSDDNEYTDFYVLEEFRIYDCSTSERTLIQSNGINNSFVYMIPNDFTGSDISIMPIGRLIKRQLNFVTIFNGESFDKGKWIVKDYDGYPLDYSDGIDPFISYYVYYDFSEESSDYYFVSSTPEAEERDGIISFGKYTYDDSNNDFSIKLNRYTILNISGSEATSFIFFKENLIKQFLINDKAYDLSNEDIKIKVGDRIHLEINKDYKTVYSGLEKTFDKVDENSIYEFTVPDTPSYLASISIEKRTATLPGYNPMNIDNAFVILYKQDGSVVGIGEEVDDNEKITVNIQANTGYYVSGSGAKSGVYSKEMTYSSYYKNIDSIISKLEIKKLISVTLNSIDNYGIVTFTLDDNETTGTIFVREDQKLKLNYVLTDLDYKIDNNSILPFVSDLLDNNKTSVDIKIDSSLDGKIIVRSDYISIKKR